MCVFVLCECTCVQIYENSEVCFIGCIRYYSAYFNNLVSYVISQDYNIWQVVKYSDSSVGIKVTVN